jgi:hypothetical protein
MTKVLIASMPNGSLQDSAGNARIDPVEFRLANGTAPDHFDGTLVTHYSDSIGSGGTTTPITPDVLGRILRYIDSGYYKQITNPSNLVIRQSLDFHAVSGTVEARLDHIPINLLDSLAPYADVTGNGTTNDAAAIQARFDLAGVTGRPVLVPEPSVAYALGTTSLTIATGNFRLIGVGAKSLFTSSSTTQAILVNDAVDLVNIYIGYIGITGT